MHQKMHTTTRKMKLTSEITVTEPMEIATFDASPSSETEIVDRVELLVDRIHKCEQDKLLYLLEIYNNQYWKIEYPSFEKFCKNRLGYSKQYVYRCINAGKMLEAGIPVENPNQSLALEGLDIEEAKEVWDKAEETAASTGKDVSGTMLKKAREERQLVERAESGDIDIEALKAPFQEVVVALREAKDLLHALCQSQDGAAWLHYQSVATKIRDAAEEVKYAMPDSVCGSCGGAGCSTCKGLGWLPKARTSAETQTTSNT